jgi:predicted dienelactone hydrolase
MMLRISAVAGLALFSACATLPHGRITDPVLAPLAERGPFTVAQYDSDWLDAKRQRHVPVHIYAPDSPSSTMPVIILSHGLGSSRTGYRYLGEHWASHGYISVHPEHLGTEHASDRRNRIDFPADLSFVIDQLESDDALPPPLRGHIDRSRIGVAGHSFGAYGALAMGGLRVLFPDHTVINFRDSRVRAAIPISMSENFQPASYTEIAIPMLHITGTRDWDLLYGTWARKRRVPFNSIRRDDQYLVVVRGANHSTFSEEESSETQRAHDAVRIASLLFWNAYLRDDKTALAELHDGEMASALAGVARVSIKPPTATRIGRISIRTAPLFDAEEVGRGGFYRAANVVAVRTPEKLIRRLLLFREGDPYDPAKLAESERNLRALDFLKSASVTASDPHDGVVDVAVATQDALTTDVNADFSNDGGRSLYDISLTQMDVLGSGGAVALDIANGRERRVHSIAVRDPVMFGHYWDAGALLAKNSDGNEERLSIERPLLSHATHFTTNALSDHLLQIARTYANAAISSQFRQQHREAMFAGGVAIGSSETRATRVIAGIDFVTDSFVALRSLAPDDRRFRFVQLGFDRTEFRFVKLDHVDFGLREQDFNLGFHAVANVARSPGVWRFRADNSYGYALGQRSFVITHLIATTRAGATNRNAVWSNDTLLVVRMPTDFPQTFVSRLRIDIGSALDRDLQFFADGQNGLRAYPNFAFEGNRRFLFNMEHRLFLGREILQIVEPGAAIFFDTGEAVTNAPLHPHDFRTDFGIGLRLAIARLESAIIRVDIGYALNDSPISRRGMVISVATTQAF